MSLEISVIRFCYVPRARHFPALTGLAAGFLQDQMGQGRLGSGVSAQRVTVLSLDVRRRRRRRAQLLLLLLLLQVHHVAPPRQEGVAQELSQQRLLRQVIQELGEVLHRQNEIRNTIRRNEETFLKIDSVM